MNVCILFFSRVFAFPAVTGICYVFLQASSHSEGDTVELVLIYNLVNILMKGFMCAFTRGLFLTLHQSVPSTSQYELRRRTIVVLFDGTAEDRLAINKPATNIGRSPAPWARRPSWV